MGAPMPDSLRAALHRQQPPEWAIACPLPYCQAKPGTPCHSPRRRPVPLGVHPSRADAWIAHQNAA
ncbi:zinc finger domain-containing protein [Kitasatospora griseola]|uniref:zinc finger domain-containing protein n=1 Tax=Kitasatospora griseola TaxID=2064 RepID=UPI003650172B